MKQLVVAAVVVVAFFSFGPWFAGKVGPGLSNLLTELASPPAPCTSPTPTATLTTKPHVRKHHRQRVHGQAKPHRRPASAEPGTRRTPTASPSPTCEHGTS